MDIELSPAEKILAEDLAPKVEAGKEYLGKEHPGWGNLIDVGDLDLSDGRFCMLGQLNESYGTYLMNSGHNDEWAMRHGFLVDHDADPRDARYDVLTKLWAAEVEAQQ